jgi:hypothetical protein
VFGGNAVSDEYGIGRHVANLFVTQTYEGQSDIHGEYPIARYWAHANLAASLDSGQGYHGDPSILLNVEVRTYYVYWAMMVADARYVPQHVATSVGVQLSWTNVMHAKACPGDGNRKWCMRVEQSHVPDPMRLKPFARVVMSNVCQWEKQRA